MQNFRQLILSSILLIVSFIYSTHSSAQFNYFGADLNFNILSINSSEFATETTNIRGMDLQLQGFIRPFRHFGLGIAIAIPGFQNSSAYLSTDNDGFTYDSEFDDRPSVSNFEYIPNSFQYNLERKALTTIFSRFFINQEYQVFLDLRYSFLKVNERYSYIRTEKLSEFGNLTIPKDIVSWNEEISLSGLGFAFGIMPMISDHFYYQTSVSLDILNGKGVSHTMTTGENYLGTGYQYSQFNSGLDSRNLFWRYNVGIGLFF